MWRDEDADGIQDANETNTSYGWVTLYDAAGNPVASAMVGGDGSYSFTNVAPGQYRLYVSQASFIPAPQDQGDDEHDSDVGSDGSSALFTVAEGGTTDLDVGMVYSI